MQVSLDRHSGERALVLIGGAVILALVVGYFELVLIQPASVTGPIGVSAIVLALSAPIVIRTARRSDDPWAVWILSGSVVVKVVAALTRFYINNDLYGGLADARAYHFAASAIAPGFRDGIFSLAGSGVEGLPQETQAVAWVLGGVYALIGASEAGGFIVFSWIGWLGLIACYRAFRIAFPTVRSRTCLLLLFFLPSLAYWPSSPGKEALSDAALGLVLLGLAQLFRGRSVPWGVTSFLAGMTVVLWVRPHVAMIVVVACTAALLVYRPGRGNARSVIGRLVIVALLLPALFVGIGRVDKAFGADGEELSVATVLEETRSSTSVGASAFETTPVDSPVDFPPAMVSVLLRPFPWEVHNFTMLLASVEGLLLLGLLLGHLDTLERVFRVATREPMGAFCAAFTIGFVIAFSNIGNAGILVRQRTQLMPILVLLFAATARPIDEPTTTPVGVDEPAEDHPARADWAVSR